MKVVVFTQGNIGRGLARFLAQLDAEPGVTLGAVIVDGFRVAPRKRARFLARTWGPWTFATSIIYQVMRTALARAGDLLFRAWHDRFVPPLGVQQRRKLLGRLPVKHVADIHAPESLNFIRSLDADLGLIAGGRILQPAVTGAPRLGTLNIHKHDARKYRGGAQIGYPECRNGDPVLTVTIHFATNQVDAGDVVATRDIAIERFDCDRSLAVKAEIHGMALYLDAVRQLRDGSADPVPQDKAAGTLLFTTPYLTRDLFWYKRRRRLHKALRGDPYDNPLRNLARRTRNMAAITCLPLLARKRRALEASGCAPIIIFYYHGVGNGAENWMHLPLDVFDRQVEYMQRYFEIISLAEAVRRLRSGASRSTAAVLTFDDGYASLHEVLLPYLEYHAIPASYFVCAGASESGSHLQHDTDKGYHDVDLMNTAQIRDCARRGVTIGSHGNHHEDMAKLSGAQLEHALFASADQLETWLKKRIRYFAFPFGGLENISPQALETASKRYDAVFSAYGGYNLPNGPDRRHFTRFANPTNRAGVVSVMNGMHRLEPFYQQRPGYLDW